MDSTVYAALRGFLGSDEKYSRCGVKMQERMAPYTTFRIGGPADMLITPVDAETFVGILTFLTRQNVPYRVLGNASNVLIDDDGFRGVLIRTAEVNRVSVNGEILIAEAGVSLAKAARLALDASLTGFEKLSGIPGTVGGALCMNAGAYGATVSDILESVRVFDTDTQTVRDVPKTELRFSYRSSMIDDHTWVALNATFRLSSGNREIISAEMRSLNERRVHSQPLEYPSAGSVFKRPPNDYAGRLIEAAGLKGTRVGDAEVSVKHAGFIVNRGAASARDVRALVSLIRARVRETSDVLLVPEIDMIPEMKNEE